MNKLIKRNICTDFNRASILSDFSRENRTISKLREIQGYCRLDLRMMYDVIIDLAGLKSEDNEEEFNNPRVINKCSIS